MSFFKKLSDFFASSQKPADNSYWITVKCNRCGEVIRARVNLLNDLSANYGDSAGDTTYFCRKVLMGSQQCYQQIEVELTFDAAHHLAQQEIHGGQFLEEEKG